MAKTKEQKQKEALERTRALFPDKLREYLESQRDGSNYERISRDYGKESAETYSYEARRKFREWCDSCHLDYHGNLKDMATI